MRRFLKKMSLRLVIFSSPFLLFVFMYVYRDVHCDFGINRSYSVKYWFNAFGDFATKKLEHSDRKDYNTFIFGSSRSVYNFGCYIKERIFGNDAGTITFHYANWSETIGGIHHKLLYLRKRGFRLKNVIIFIDTDLTFKGNGEITDVDHYLLTGKSKVESIAMRFSGFNRLNWKNKIKILAGQQPEDRLRIPHPSDPVSNDFAHYCSGFSYDDLIAETNRKNKLRADTDTADPRKGGGEYMPEAQISAAEHSYLIQIKEMLDQTNYAVIINPLYHQKKFHPRDLALLTGVFGSRLLDLSGVNDLTKDHRLYPDKSHFHPALAKRLIDSIANNGILSVR